MTASADGFRLADQDAFATARGEAFVATADNASAIYYNPAGITQLEGFNFRGGFYGIYLDPTFTPPRAPANANTYHIDHQYQAAPQAFATFTPQDWRLSFGLGGYAPFGGNMIWPQDTGFRSVALSGSLTYLTINPVVALKLAPGLSIAAGAMVNYADLETEQGILRNPFPLTNYFRFQGNGWGAGYNLGLLWQPIEQISLGATYRSAAPMGLSGNTYFEQYPVRGLYPASSRVASADYTFPWIGVLGISYRPTPKWNLEFDVDYTDWSTFQSINLYQQSPPPGLKTNTPIKLYWQGACMYEFGATRYFDNGWHVSAGYVYSANAVPDTYYTPLAADMARHFFSLGAGFRGQLFDFDIAYQVGYGPAHTVAGSNPPSNPGIASSGQTADGTYDFISNAVLLTVGVHF